MNLQKLPGGRRRLALLLAAAGIVAAATVGAISVRGKTDERARTPIPVALEFLANDVVLVEARTLETRLPLTGTLVPLVEATIKSKIAGELTAVAAREGEKVAKGQPLARIDPVELRARLAARNADVAAARAQLELAEKNRATQKALVEKAFISQNAFDATQSSHDVAQARLQAAEAELALARKSLDDTVLYAPFGGVVAQRFAQPGERVGVDARILSIVDLSRLELEAAIPASEIARVRVGQRVSFRVDGYGEREFAGRIERINPGTIAGSRSINVYAVIDNRGGALRAGLFAQGALVLARMENVLTVPVSALREGDGQPFLYVLTDGHVRRRIVKAGPADASGIAPILEGLAAGERIVKNNLGALREGAPARVAPN